MRYYNIFKNIKDVGLEVKESEIYEDYFAEFYHKFCDRTKYDLDFYTEQAFSLGKKDVKILELACGTGRISIPLLARNFKVEAVDLSEAMLEILKKGVDNVPRKFKNNIIIKKKNILELDYNDEFDMVIFPATTICLIKDKDIELLFEVVYKALKKGGKFVFDYVKEDGNKTGFKSSQRQFVEIDKDELCIYQEFKDYDKLQATVNFYVEKGSNKYLTSTTKNMVLREKIEEVIEKSKFSPEKYTFKVINESDDSRLIMNILQK